MAVEIRVHLLHLSHILTFLIKTSAFLLSATMKTDLELLSQALLFVCLFCLVFVLFVVDNDENKPVDVYVCGFICFSI
jgi:hypothetical protein